MRSSVTPQPVRMLADEEIPLPRRTAVVADAWRVEARAIVGSTPRAGTAAASTPSNSAFTWMSLSWRTYLAVLEVRVSQLFASKPGSASVRQPREKPRQSAQVDQRPAEYLTSDHRRFWSFRSRILIRHTGGRPLLGY